MSPKILVPVVIGILVGIGLVAIGFWAKSSAPTGANAATALYITGGVAGVLTLLAIATVAMPAGARNTVAISSIVCLVAAGAIGGRIYPTYKGQERYVAAKEQWDRAIAEKKRPDSPGAMEAFLKEADPEGNGQTHDKQYLVNALSAACGVALFGSLLLFATRPKAE